MKIILTLLLFCTLFSACKDKKLSAKYLSNMIVVRETEAPQKVAPVQQDSLPPITPAPTPKVTPVVPANKYHIIVASFSATDKAAAEKFTDQLKKKDYPATLLSSPARYRVSIESFPTETAANKAREKYCTLMNRSDLWVFKTK